MLPGRSHVTLTAAYLGDDEAWSGQTRTKVLSELSAVWGAPLTGFFFLHKINLSETSEPCFGARSGRWVYKEATTDLSGPYVERAPRASRGLVVLPYRLEGPQKVVQGKVGEGPVFRRGGGDRIRGRRFFMDVSKVQPESEGSHPKCRVSGLG